MNGFGDRLPGLRKGGAVLTVAVAVTAAAAGCSNGPGNTASSASLSITPGHAGILRLADGLRVDVPARAVTGNGTLSATVGSAPTAAPRGMELTGPVYDLRLAGTSLAASVILTVPVPRPSGHGAAAGPDTALLAYYDQASGQWRPVSATYHPATGTLTAAVGHLSIWSVLRLAGQQALNSAGRALNSFLGAVTAIPPSCPNAGQLASAGVTVTADPGDLITWCADDSNGAVVLRVVDNRGYAIEASYPAGWSMTRPGTMDPVTSAILSGLPALSLRAGGPDVQTVIIPGGQEADITPQAGASGIVLAAPSPEGIIIDALRYAASTLDMTYGDIPGAAPTPGSTAKAIADTFSDAACVTKMDSVIQSPDVSTPEAAGALFRTFTDIAAGCIAGQWSGAYGITGLTAASVTGTLLWFADSLNGVIEDSQAAVDSALYWNGYHITVRQAGGQTVTLRVPANVDGGIPTGIGLTMGSDYTINGSGSAQYGYDPADPCSGNPTTHPDGSRYLGTTNCGPKYDPSAALPSAPIGALIWRIGNGPWQPAPTKFTAATAGPLYLAYNDDPGLYGDNSGSYTATVTCSSGC